MCVFTLPTASIDLVLIGLHTLQAVRSRKNYEDPTLFTLSTFLWPKSSSAREKKAPCWQRMATAMAAPTRVVK